MNAALCQQKKQLEEDLSQIRDRNREDASEIERLNVQNDQKGKESVELTGKIRGLEYDIAKSLSRIEELNRVLDQKTYELKTKEQQLQEAESEEIKLKT